MPLSNRCVGLSPHAKSFACCVLEYSVLAMLSIVRICISIMVGLLHTICMHVYDMLAHLD